MSGSSRETVGKCPIQHEEVLKKTILFGYMSLRGCISICADAGTVQYFFNENRHSQNYILLWVVAAALTFAAQK